MSKLPTGIAGAYSTLSHRCSSLEIHDRLTTLAWYRILTDPSMPWVAGNDPRTILSDPIHWSFFPWGDTKLLDTLTDRLNEVMGEPLLTSGWEAIGGDTVERTVAELSKWRTSQVVGADMLGELSQHVTSEAAKSSAGAFYTPYSVSMLMASMLGPKPGESVMDPCCGSGTMLLAAIEACRAKYGHDQVPEVYGVDIDPRAVRMTKLNLVLAGIHPNNPGTAKSPRGPRIENRNALELMRPPTEHASQRWMQLQLGLFTDEGRNGDGR